ncbi:MAG TPA: NAD-dependent epimerase/dehydratase family protein [Polyangiaceae bacterium]|jgi:nucleoside-diphosphate-sugar epimerase|nr:NAD-dependent epimerase/dehydratase family protein [Polyangiaceae bacterium]
MRVLFIGGTGIISSGCAKRLVRQPGVELTFLKRGQSDRSVPEGVEVVNGDVRDPASLASALGHREFDVVVDWVAFTPAHVQADVNFFAGRTAQYVFISSASAYQTPPLRLPVTESTPLRNPIWRYSRDKIACEELLVRAYRDSGFPCTIVRPSHTYDARSLPVHGGYTVIDRMRRGKPVIVHGDGTSLWVLTHHDDFARGFNGLLGNPHVLGEAFHVTSDELLTWNQIHELLAAAAGAEAKLVHVPSATIASYDAHWGDSLLGDKTHSMIFDNSKVKRVVPGFAATIPYAEGAREQLAWYDAEPARRSVDAATDALMDTLAEAQARAAR